MRLTLTEDGETAGSLLVLQCQCCKCNSSEYFLKVNSEQPLVFSLLDTRLQVFLK